MASNAQHMTLLLDFSRREIQSRYQSSYLGLVWMILTPLLTLGVYAVAFSVILGVHEIGGQNADPVEYVLSLFCGLIIFFFFSEVLSGAPDLISKKSNFVKKVIFPLPILVVSRVLASSIALLVSVIILTVMIVLYKQGLSPSVMYLPIVLLPTISMMIGLALVVSAFGVYLPDIGQITTPFMRMAFYLTPIVYPLSIIPSQYQTYFWLNPMTSMTFHLKTVLISGTPPDWLALAWFYLAAILILGIGYLIFERLRGGFADVI